MEWITSDLHLGHDNIILYCGRPWLQAHDWYNDPEYERPRWVSEEIKETRTVEMNMALVDNWNETVDPQDTVKHLGDFCFWKSKSGSPQWWEGKLKGKIIHFKGNHDRRRQIKGMLQAATMKAGGHEFLLQHHPPSRIEEIPDFCDVVLCGHVHERWDHKWRGDVLMVNVGVDVRGFKPMAMDEVIGIADKLQKERK